MRYEVIGIIPEFIQSMHAHGFNLKPEEAMTLVEMFDRDSTGDVRREEFADTVKRLLKMPTGARRCTC